VSGAEPLWGNSQWFRAGSSCVFRKSSSLDGELSTEGNVYPSIRLKAVALPRFGAWYFSLNQANYSSQKITGFHKKIILSSNELNEDIRVKLLNLSKGEAGV
jgi:hypothetical protein